MPSPRQLFGSRGEDLAAAWYESHGYELVAQNWRCSSGEADLIVRKAATLVICEVKARSSDRFGSPAEAVTKTRQLRLRRTAAAYLARMAEAEERRPQVVRFDVACVIGEVVELIEAAF
ncbi:MAG: YraN family protein [Acidimicrobiales bacterium]